jgi:putative copper resistance protein D
MILFGSPLFFLYGLPAREAGAATTLAWPRPLLTGAAILCAVTAAAALSAQTAVMSGALSDALSFDAVRSAVTDTQFGLGTASRLALAVALAVILALARLSHAAWIAASAIGAGLVASFAWTGHGALGEGAASWVHLSSDVLHLLAAAVWLGALASLALMLWPKKRARRVEELRVLHRALAGFSGVGLAVVAVLLGTGLINSWFLVGTSHLTQIAVTPYGLVLTAKVALFMIMLGLAAANRFRLTPRLKGALDDTGPAAPAVAALWRSVLVETLLGACVLVLVSALGTLAPPTSS